jgi:Bacterial antitoxin of type II TA system, VapB
MARITVDVNEEWLEAAQELLGTQTKVGTINEALRTFAVRKKAAEIAAAFATAKVDLGGSEAAWRYGGGRDLSRFAEDARREDVA